MTRGNWLIVVASLLAVILASPQPSRAAEPTGWPSYLYDRGDGIPTSQFGTYIREKEFLVHTFMNTRTPRSSNTNPATSAAREIRTFLARRSNTSTLSSWPTPSTTRSRSSLNPRCTARSISGRRPTIPVTCRSTSGTPGSATPKPRSAGGF